MTWSTRAKNAAGSMLMGMLGRRTLARSARFLTNFARLDAENNLLENGETQVIEAVVAHLAAGEPLVAFDVGANTGMWTLEFARRTGGHRFTIHAFEPVSGTASIFRRNVKVPEVILNSSGLSDKPGTAEISVYEPGGGTSALIPDSAVPAAYRETISLTTVDAYCELRGVDRISLIKVDAEGHDLFVLRGAEKMFAEGRIAAAQFEYNHRWIWSRVFLRDVFDFARTHDYRLGKITSRGIEFYQSWDKELEKFQEGNYLLCRPDIAGWFRAIRWWAEQDAL